MSKRLATALLLLPLLVSPTLLRASDEPAVDKKQAKRDAIDEMARQTLENLLKESERARELYDHAVAYAVFDNFKFTLLLSGGGGVGVAVDRQSGSRTYMKMGSGGVGLGLGGQSYQVVFLFDDWDRYEKFVNNAWQADLSANAAAGTAGKNAPATLSGGVAVFQITNKGLMAQADISGTRFWKNKKLNR